MVERRHAPKHAVITGATRGIGWAVAQRLAADGLRVTLLGRDAARATERAASIGAASSVCDVGDAAAVERCFAALGPVDLLVNNAGIAESAPLLKSDDAQFLRLFEVNLLGVVRCTRAVLPGMLERGWGRVVNVASTAGLRGYAYTSAYAASKHAVVGLTRSLALETAKRGVTINAVCPGFVATGMTEVTLDNIVAKTGRTREQALAELTATNPQGRLVQPDEVAAAVSFLCGDDAASITGQAIAIAGGEV
jgi:NAD(P)-dependent dehydrogenase (short-subunit alcohol dehydrogenase family)